MTAVRSTLARPDRLGVDVAPFGRSLIRALFILTVLLSVALVKWNVAGIPVRSVTALLLLGVAATFRLDVIGAAIRESWTLLCIITVAALIGTVSSLLNASDAAYIGRQLLEIHVQAMVGTIVGVAVRRTCGARTVLIAFAIAVGISALFAALQFADIGPAWAARRFLNSMQAQDVQREPLMPGESRAAGLSYSAVHLGTQICLVLAALFADRLRTLGEKLLQKPDTILLLSLPVLAAAAIVSGNRSPLLGMLCFLVLYLWFAKRGAAVLLIAVAIAAYPMALMLPEVLRGLGLRIGETQDSSAVGRTVLQVYGLMLFAARPYGYGLAFDSTEHWLGFWTYLKDFDNAEAITWHALHNYYLMVINKYGVAILLLAAVVARTLMRYRWAVLGFVPYLVHIFFHNDGPLQADFLIWYIIPMFAGTALPRRKRAMGPRHTIPRRADGRAGLRQDGGVGAFASRRPAND